MLTFIHVTALTFAASVTTVLTEQMPIKSSAEIGPSYTIANENSTSESKGSEVCRSVNPQCQSDEPS